MRPDKGSDQPNYLLDSAEIGLGPEWLWFSHAKPIPKRLSEGLSPRSCIHIQEQNPTEFQIANRNMLRPGGQILVLDGSPGNDDLIQLWLRHLRRDSHTSAMPILIWSHEGAMTPFDTLLNDFRLLPDGVIGSRGWQDSGSWISRIESILKIRMKRRFHLDLQLDMSSRESALESTCCWVLNTVRLIPWMSQKSGRLRQALFELGQNAIEWGNRGDVSKTVHIRLRADERGLHVSVSDQGNGFDRNNLPHAADEEDPIRHLEIREQLGLREGGFGMLITRGLVDKMVYNAQGNTVHLSMRHRNS